MDGKLTFTFLGKKAHAENVGERDFLRTEGDPAAVGYTINETVALTRSMVCFVHPLLLFCLPVYLEGSFQNACPLRTLRV